MTITTSSQLSYFLSTELDCKRLPFDAVARLLGFQRQTLAAMITYNDFDLCKFLEQHQISKDAFKEGLTSSSVWSLIRFFAVFDPQQRGTVRESYLATISSGQFTAKWRTAAKNPRPKVVIDDLNEPFGEYYSRKGEITYASDYVPSSFELIELQELKDALQDSMDEIEILKQERIRLYDALDDYRLELRNAKEKLEMANDSIDTKDLETRVGFNNDNYDVPFRMHDGDVYYRTDVVPGWFDDNNI